MLDAESRLRAAAAPQHLARLGFRGPDVPAAADAIRRVLAQRRCGDVQLLGERLRTGIGGFLLDPVPAQVDAFADPIAAEATYGMGVLPMLALIATAEDVVAFHAARGISAELSWGSLADLGQQVWVHRQTYGEFGLHTQGWLQLAWSGALLWLGRLQFDLESRPLPPGHAGDEDGDTWVLSTHIPQSGPLSPEAVDASFAAAGPVFAAAFPERTPLAFHCHSWLLDPQLAQVLPPESNLAQFQRRWARYGEPAPGDDDVIFFVFRRRGAVDLGELPQATSLERAVVQRIRAGGHWQVWDGLIQPDGRAEGQAP